VLVYTNVSENRAEFMEIDCENSALQLRGVAVLNASTGQQFEKISYELTRSQKSSQRLQPPDHGLLIILSSCLENSSK
jgi:hypothetical protein